MENSQIALDIQLNVEGAEKAIEMAVSKRRKYMAIAVEKSTTPVPEYAGPYTVVSQLFYGQTLETGGKKMTEDLTVDPIPIYEVSNPKGGLTVTIGSR